jgi:hypothetical protein
MITIFTALLLMSSTQAARSQSQPAKPASQGETTEIAATDLYAAFKNDPQGAEKKFKGKRLVVTGVVGARDNEPKAMTKKILVGPKGSDEKNELVACYFEWDDESTFYRLNAKPPPPIIGVCAGYAESEYGKKGNKPLEVRLLKCEIPKVTGVKSPYDIGFAEGHATGVAHMKLFQVNAKAAKENIEKTLDVYTEIYEVKADNERPGGVLPSDVDRVEGLLDGYLKAVEASGVK